MKKLMMAIGTVAALGLTACGGDDTNTPPADPTMSAVTFEVDLVSKADGTNDLAKVNAGEKVFLAGDLAQAAAATNCDYGSDTWGTTEYTTGPLNAFPCWKPQQSQLAMNDQGNGKYTLTLNIKRGRAIQFKATKSMNTSCDPTKTAAKDIYDTCGWSNGIKNFKKSTDADWPSTACKNDTTKNQGLFEVPNVKFTVPDAATATAPVIKAEAWRDYASKTYGYVSCD